VTTPMVSIGNFFFRYRNALFPIALLLFLLPSPTAFPQWWMAALAGGGLIVLGQLIRAVSVELVYIVRGGRKGKVYADDLVTEGMFAHCRNPLYVGNYLGILGAVVASNSVVALAVGGILFFIAYLSITLAEENFLSGKFGKSYDQYCADTPRFAMKLSGLGATFRASKFNWKRLIMKEYGTMFVSLAGLILILLFTRHYHHGLPWFADGWDTLLLISFGVLGVLYSLARWMKKSGRLKE